LFSPGNFVADEVLCQQAAQLISAAPKHLSIDSYFGIVIPQLTSVLLRVGDRREHYRTASRLSIFQIASRYPSQLLTSASSLLMPLTVLCSLDDDASAVSSNRVAVDFIREQHRRCQELIDHDDGDTIVIEETRMVESLQFVQHLCLVVTPPPSIVELLFPCTSCQTAHS
jgi:hypothetical protein